MLGAFLSQPLALTYFNLPLRELQLVGSKLNPLERQLEAVVQVSELCVSRRVALGGIYGSKADFAVKRDEEPTRRAGPVEPNGVQFLNSHNMLWPLYRSLM